MGNTLASLAVAGLGVAAAIGGASPAAAARDDYVGAEVCGGCHREALAIWEKSAHARASESLGRRVAARRCLTCHSTGEAPAGRPYFSGVQCEACHGPGHGYSPEDVMRNPTLAVDLGLRDLSSKEQRALLCAECHRSSTRLRRFDGVRAWQRIVH